MADFQHSIPVSNRQAVAAFTSSFVGQTYDPLLGWKQRSGRRKPLPKRPTRAALEALLAAIFADAVPIAAGDNLTVFILPLEGKLIDLAAAYDVAREDVEQDDFDEDTHDAEEDTPLEPWLGWAEWPQVESTGAPSAYERFFDANEADDADLAI